MVSAFGTGTAMRILWAALLGGPVAWAQAPGFAGHDHGGDRARAAFSHALPKLNGDHLKATVVEVRYGPGEFSPPHIHACAVILYVIQGAIRSQVKGEAEAVFKAGESFYEGANGVHLISANASRTEPAAFVAYFVCDHDTPSTGDVPETRTTGGN